MSAETNTVRTESTVLGVSNRRATLALYALAVFMFWMGQYIYLPTLPSYAQTKADDLQAIGFVLSMYGLFQAVVRIPLGVASDWLGSRKLFIVGGFILAGAGAWIMGTSDSIEGLALGRAITGASTGAWVALIVAFSAQFPPEQAIRASSILMLFNSGGRIIGTAITGTLNDLGGYPLPFYVATALGAIAVMIILPIGEQRHPSRPPSVRSILHLAARRDVLLPTLLSTVSQYVLWTTSFGFVAVLAKQFGATNLLQSALVTFHISMAALGTLIATSHGHRIGARRMVYLSFVFLFVGTIAAALAPSLEFLFVAPAFLGTSLGIAYPVLMGMSIEQVNNSERATAMGLHQAIYAIGMFGGPALSGVIADAVGLQPMFGITAFASLALGLVGTRLLQDRARTSEVGVAIEP